MDAARADTSFAGNAPVLLGEDDFRAIADDHGFFIDKTLFIKEFMENTPKITAILRPRRFGKSTNLTMLKSFLFDKADPQYFSTLAIAKDISFVKQHFKQYPVLHLSLKNCRGRAWNDMLTYVWAAVRQMAKDHRDAIVADDKELIHIDFSSAGVPEFFADSLSGLINAVHALHKRRVIVLVDEYDGPLSVAHRNGYYAEAAEFFSSFYTDAFKGMFALKKACLMGVLEVGGSGFLSGLNNIEIVTVCNEKFAKYFGFTKQEILPYVGESLNEVINWYNGYCIGGFELINPWSFSYWLLNKKIGLYWAGSSKVDSLSAKVSEHLHAVLNTAIDLSFNEERSIELTNLPMSVNYGLPTLPSGVIWYFLIFTGYLTFKPNPGNVRSGFASIPNLEVRQYWQEEMSLVVSENLRSIPGYLENLTLALKNFQLDPLKLLLEELLLGASCYDLPRESSYHCIIYTILRLLLLGDEQIAQVSSNKESREGRYDIAVYFPALMRSIIFEFKKSDSETDMKSDSIAGLAQIKDNDYASSFPGCTCFLVAMAFYKKNVSAFETEKIIVPSVIERLGAEMNPARRSTRNLKQ